MFDDDVDDEIVNKQNMGWKWIKRKMMKMDKKDEE